MTLNNDQIRTVLLLIETSQLPEPELSEAWGLHREIELTQGKHMTTINSWNSVDGGTRHEIATNRATCAGCPTVRECPRIAAECPNVTPAIDSQHARDSAELRSLCQARDDARRERDRLAAEVADLRAQLAAVGAGGVSGRLMGVVPGWKLVPIEPTQEISEFLNERLRDHWFGCAGHVYKEIIEIAPQVPPTAQPVDQWQKRHPEVSDGQWINTDEFDARWWVDNCGSQIRSLCIVPQPQQSTPVQQSAATSERLALALEKVMSWIDNWSPSFTDDDEWGADGLAARDALAAYRSAINPTGGTT